MEQLIHPLVVEVVEVMMQQVNLVVPEVVEVIQLKDVVMQEDILLLKDLMVDVVPVDQEIVLVVEVVVALLK